jgi:hypothetical protein
MINMIISIIKTPEDVKSFTMQNIDDQYVQKTMNMIEDCVSGKLPLIKFCIDEYTHIFPTEYLRNCVISTRIFEEKDKIEAKQKQQLKVVDIRKPIQEDGEPE